MFLAENNILFDYFAFSTSEREGEAVSPQQSVFLPEPTSDGELGGGISQRNELLLAAVVVDDDVHGVGAQWDVICADGEGGVHKPTHPFNHTLDLVLTYGIEIDHLIVFPHNPLLCDHYMITQKYRF